MYQNVKDLKNIKKKMKESVQQVQHLAMRKPERDIRKKEKKGRGETIK